MIQTINSFAEAVRDSTPANFWGNPIRNYKKAFINIAPSSQWNARQKLVANALKSQSKVYEQIPYLAKYALPAEEINKKLLTENQIEELRKELKVGDFKNVSDLNRRLRDRLNFPQEKIDLIATWAFGTEDPSSLQAGSIAYRLQAERFIYAYHANRVIAGKSEFTKEQLDKDFKHVIESFGHIKFLEAEKLRVRVAVQDIVRKETNIDLSTPEGLQKAKEIENRAKIYHRQLRCYHADEKSDPAIRRIAKKMEKLQQEIDTEKDDEVIQQKAFKLASYRREYERLIELKDQGQSYPGISRANRDLSFDRFLRESQEEILNITISYENGLISGSVWKSELQKIFRSEIYLYKLIQGGGINNLNVEEMDVLARNLKRELKRFDNFIEFMQGKPNAGQEILSYALSLPIKIILDDINLNLLAQMSNQAVARALNSQFREISAAALASLQGKNSDFFRLLAFSPADIALKTASRTATNWLQGQVNSYIFSNENSARRLRAANDWLRYTWDPVLNRYVARNPVGISYRSVLALFGKDYDEFVHRVFGKNDSALNADEKAQLEKIKAIYDRYTRANFYGQYEEASAARKAFEELLTEEQKTRINPGINRIDPKTDKNFFIGRFIQSNQILSDEDTLTFNRLLLLERQLQLELSGRFGLAQQAQGLAEWEFDMVQRLKKYHILSYALGSGLNPTAFKQRDYNRLTRIMETQYKYLRDFVFDILNDSKMSESRFIARLMQYASSTAISYFIGKVERHIRSKWKKGRRVTTSGESCEGCIREANKGWVRLEDMASIGAVGPCFSNCKCIVQFRRED